MVRTCRTVRCQKTVIRQISYLSVNNLSMNLWNEEVFRCDEKHRNHTFRFIAFWAFKFLNVGGVHSPCDVPRRYLGVPCLESTSVLQLALQWKQFARIERSKRGNAMPWEWGQLVTEPVIQSGGQSVSQSINQESTRNTNHKWFSKSVGKNTTGFSVFRLSLFTHLYMHTEKKESKHISATGRGGSIGLWDVEDPKFSRPVLFNLG
jgi:hypothetical protein